eukprot:s2840_g7.t1
MTLLKESKRFSAWLPFLVSNKQLGPWPQSPKHPRWLKFKGSTPDKSSKSEIRALEPCDWQLPWVQTLIMSRQRPVFGCLAANMMGNTGHIWRVAWGYT